MIVKSADPATLDGASLKKMLNEIEALIVNDYSLKSIIECSGEIWGVFLLNKSDIKKKTSTIEPIIRLDKYADTTTLTTANTEYVSNQIVIINRDLCERVAWCDMI